jgi:hypothetical protein
MSLPPRSSAHANGNKNAQWTTGLPRNPRVICVISASLQVRAHTRECMTTRARPGGDSTIVWVAPTGFSMIVNTFVQ